MAKKNKIVIGLIGEKGSGKGVIARYLIEKYQAEHFGTSRILKRTIDDLSLPATRDNLIKLALVLKEGFWHSVVIDALIKEMEKSQAPMVIADGIRMHGDVEPFQKKYGKNFKLIYITAPINIRYERTLKRKEKVGEDKTTFEQFLADEGKLTEISIHEIGAGADLIIDNVGSLEKIYKQIDRFLN